MIMMTMMIEFCSGLNASSVRLAAVRAICNNYLRIPSECANFARCKKLAKY